jgi:hypothetical protein
MAKDSVYCFAADVKGCLTFNPSIYISLLIFKNT